MTTREILIAARALIERPEDWCRGAYARSATGRECFPTSPHAKSRCGLGAVSAAMNMSVPYWMGARACLVEKALMAAIGGVDFGPWQDHATHTQVVAAFDRAISMLPEEP
jgi:hypothetical protein